MIAVVVPAHDEERLLGACLASVARAARHVALRHLEVQVVVVLDRCRDASGAIALAAGATCLPLEAGNVGRARAHGVAHAIEAGAGWVAMTDADSEVPPDWLAAQLACDADVFCGMVEVVDWSGFADGMGEAFDLRHPGRLDHPHVHGANLGFTADAYRRSGGFAPLSAHEDVVLVEAMRRSGATIARLPAPRVATSARQVARVEDGFARYLRELQAAMSATAGTPPAPAATWHMLTP